MDDGGDGGGINLGDVAWGERALSLANEVLLRDFGVDFKLFGFKISPKGYIYIRLDKFSNRLDCEISPSCVKNRTRPTIFCADLGVLIWRKSKSSADYTMSA